MNWRLSLLSAVALALPGCLPADPAASQWLVPADAPGQLVDQPLAPVFEELLGLRPEAIRAGSMAPVRYDLTTETFTIPLGVVSGKPPYETGDLWYLWPGGAAEGRFEAAAGPPEEAPIRGGSRHRFYANDDLLRSGGEREAAQPFGQHVLATRLEEVESWTVRPDWQVLPLFGRSQPETQGRGTLVLEVSAPDGAIRTLVEIAYDGASGSIEAQWSPDGRWLLITDPEKAEAYGPLATLSGPARLRGALFGPFATEIPRAEVLAALAETARAAEVRALRGSLAAGELSPESFYGPAYGAALAAIRACAAVLAVVGPLERIQLVKPGHDHGLQHQGTRIGHYLDFEIAGRDAAGQLQWPVFDPDAPAEAVRAVSSQITGVLETDRGTAYIRTCY